MIRRVYCGTARGPVAQSDEQCPVCGSIAHAEVPLGRCGKLTDCRHDARGHCCTRLLDHDGDCRAEWCCTGFVRASS